MKSLVFVFFMSDEEDEEDEGVKGREDNKDYYRLCFIYVQIKL